MKVERGEYIGSRKSLAIVGSSTLCYTLTIGITDPTDLSVQMPASSSSPSDSRQKWRKTKGPKNWKRHRSADEEDEDDEEDENDVVEADEDEDLHPNPNPNPNPNSNSNPKTQNETTTQVVGWGGGGGVRISEFPVAVKQAVNCPHTSVMMMRHNKQLVMENISYGQLQALSAVPTDNLLLLAAPRDQQGSLSLSLVITPPPITQGRGRLKIFWNRLHLLPVHADWFQPTTVHRLERQVVPHFFSGKSPEKTPEKYMDCRNFIVAKYMENVDKRLSLEDCQGLAVGLDKEDLNRIFRFLDHWGIINYCAPPPRHEHWSVDSYLREDTNGEVHVPSATLKSIDSLIIFDKPKCRVKPHQVYSSLSSIPNDVTDLDSTIRERLSESCCNYCSCPLLVVYYQSVKEVDTSLCPDCYHEGRNVIGHSSMDFIKVDTTNDCDQDAESWTDEETLLLLEAFELYNDNWNEIADHVGTKSKAQCILHFLRLPMEDGLLENVEVPTTSSTSNGSHKDDPRRLYLNTNGPNVEDSASESRFPFANSGNPIMHLVAFLASFLGPRVAAACAHASLAVLSEDDGSDHTNRMESSDDGPVEMRNPGLQKEENLASQGSLGPDTSSAEASPIAAEKVKSAAKVGLVAAAMKAKLFADHEEREIQRLSASIINHQLKRLELKLKQFAEIETLLMKECEQVEKTRQRLAEERARAIGTRFGPGGVSSVMTLPGVAPQLVNNNIANSRSLVMSVPPSQPGVSGYPNNQMGHSQMPLMARQQQMFSFGPRLPLSAIQPTSSGASSTAMFGAQGSGQPSLSHPMLRTVPGTSSGMG